MVRHYKTRAWSGFKRRPVAARPDLLNRADLRLTDRRLRRERERVERTRGQPVEFARSGYPDFDFLIPIYADGTVGDTALYPLSADDLVDGQ